MRTITNDYHDAQVFDLGSRAVRGPYLERGPYLVTQTGVSPRDPLPKTRMFVLRPDGCWVDFNAYACQGKPEVMDELVFPGIAEVMQTFSRLFGPPRFLDLPINEEGLKAWIERQKSGNPLDAALEWAKEYKVRHRKDRGR
jgi:hypothetical protein